MSDVVIIFPENELLKKEIEKLRTELSMLVLEYDELRLVECKNIETAYMLAIGGLEYKMYELKCHYLRLKRTMKIIQAMKNRQEKIVITLIEEILDREFEEYTQKIEQERHKMNAAIEHSKLKTMTEED